MTNDNLSVITHMRPLRVVFYPDGDRGPVWEFFESLKMRQSPAISKLALDLDTLAEEGLRSRKISIRPMGQGLWELKRRFGGVQFRIFFCLSDGCVWLLHAIEKKSAKTPLDDLRLARKRMRGCVA